MAGQPPSSNNHSFPPSFSPPTYAATLRPALSFGALQQPLLPRPHIPEQNQLVLSPLAPKLCASMVDLSQRSVHSAALAFVQPPLLLHMEHLQLQQSSVQQQLPMKQSVQQYLPSKTVLAESRENQSGEQKRVRFTNQESLDSPLQLSAGEGKLRGERRLRITFESLGTSGKYPQLFGKSGKLFIPDGLIGTHRFYNENWKFEVHHGELLLPKIPRIHWRVTNLATNRSHEIAENLEELEKRVIQGRTVCNKLFRIAMEDRAKSLERELEHETNLIKVTRTQSLIRTLRPKVFSEGPLVFGLQHQVVQERMNVEIHQASATASS